jgi:hypothetical protein
MRGKIALEEYFAQNNFWLTTSGNFRTQTLIDAMLEIGADRILFRRTGPWKISITPRIGSMLPQSARAIV